MVLPGARGRAAAKRFHLYRHGPCRVEARHVTGDPDRPLSVAHVVVTDAFAGVERYVCQVAEELDRRGHRLSAIGGDPVRMRSELPDAVTNRPAGHLVRRPPHWPRTGASTWSTST